MLIGRSGTEHATCRPLAEPSALGGLGDITKQLAGGDLRRLDARSERLDRRLGAPPGPQRGQNGADGGHQDDRDRDEPQAPGQRPGLPVGNFGLDEVSSVMHLVDQGAQLLIDPVDARAKTRQTLIGPLGQGCGPGVGELREALDLTDDMP